jgi:hypothetical protein
MDFRLQRRLVAQAPPTLSAPRSNLQLANLGGAGIGRVVPIIPETDFQFDGRNVGGVEQLVVLAERIDAIDFSSASLIVRYHTKGSDGTWSSSTCTAAVRVFNMSFAEEEPHTLFAEASARATITIANSDSAPRLYVTSLTAPIAAELRIVLAWIQGTTASGTSEKLSIAVDLVGRV